MSKILGRPTPSALEPHYLERTQRNHFWVGGLAGQKRISELTIAVAGLGGMGSHISELLVRAGVRKLRLSDPDTVSVSNINRQVIANQETVGMTKREALQIELMKIAPDLELTLFDGVKASNVHQFIEGCDAVVDEIDVFPLRAHLELHRVARQQKLPIYSAYVVGMGTHFYKFEGNEFTFEDMLGSVPEQLLDTPTAEYLMKVFGEPLPAYLHDEKKHQYLNEIKTGNIPIFGPATLLGQSLLVTRLLKDLLTGHMEAGELTPVMPQFLVLDPIELNFKQVTFQSAGSAQREVG